MNIRIKLAAVVAFAAAVPAFAQIKINDNLSVTGWSAASYQYANLKGTAGNPNLSADSFNVDSALLGATITPTKNVTATVSLYYRPSGGTAVPTGTADNIGVSPNGSEVTLLDAYVTYDAGGGLTVTAGKFLSYLGYESFYAPSDNMITLANQQFLAPIPGYHEGVKFDYAVDKTTTFGFALVDSLYPKPGYNATEGDGELKHNAGAEGYIQYTGVNNLTLWFGAGYDSKGQASLGQVHDVYVLDLWASYQIDKNSSVAVEEIYKDGGLVGTKGSNWLAYYQYNFTDKLSSWFGFSGEDVSQGGPRYWKASISPAYALTSNLSVKAQYSYTKYSKFTASSANFFGGEVIFKF
jgi:hypothetical protein